ncbi:MAG: 50S ribosomal protein L4, partial [Candidatus Curtissbacteria bacterium GW2011_GWA1_40_24]
KPNDKKLKLSKKMKRRALVSALSQKAKTGEILVVSNFEKMETKTKIAANFLKKLKIDGKTLVVLEENKKNIKLAMRNIPDVNIDLADSLNAYEVLSHKNLMLEKEAIAKFK